MTCPRGSGLPKVSKPSNNVAGTFISFSLFDRPVAEIDDNNLAAHVHAVDQGEEMSEWQPIETAPRDGTEILLFARGPYKDDYRGVGQWSGQRNDWFWNFAIRPTHWMPLPEPPR